MITSAQVYQMMRAAQGSGVGVMGHNRNDALQSLGINPGTVFGEDAIKALALDGNFGTAADNMVGESLDNVIFRLTMDENNHVAFMRRVYNYVARAHIEEYRRVSKLGLLDFNANVRQEINLGQEDNPRFDSVQDTIRYKGRVAIVSRTLQRASMAKFNDMLARVSMLHITALLLSGEWSMFWGDNSLNDLEIDGTLARLKTDSTHLKDLSTRVPNGSRTEGYEITAGGSLDSDTVRQFMQVPIFKGGRHTALYCAPTDVTNISLTEDSRQRWGYQKDPSVIETGKIVGKIANSFANQGTDVVWTPFLEYERGREQDIPKDPTKLTGADAEFHKDVPAALSTAPTVAAASNGVLPSSGTFYYAVAPVSNAGEGPMKTDRTLSASTSAGNGTINVTITHPAHVADIKSYRIYRSSAQPATNNDNTVFRLVGEVARASSAVAGGTQVWADDGSFVPGSRRAILMDERVVRIPELLKPSQRDLADVTNAHQRSFDWEYGYQMQDDGEYGVQFKNAGGSVTNPS